MLCSRHHPGPPLSRLVSCITIKCSVSVVTVLIVATLCCALLRCRLLALCAHLAAGLPYRRADEAHTVVYHVNVLVSRRGEDVRSALKLSLDDRLPDPKSPGQEMPQVHTRIMPVVLCMYLCRQR